ncbi:hypothetical protein GCM10010492_01570 [Saccharothrix mutabilis subsp. mutabilis]|uniref:Uncharacterized protein n=1 Tax=Saccharothrix mutabilis subsp. mutabilis TaxID=66855 RepID=A0ABN0SZP0_9PSEU
MDALEMFRPCPAMVAVEPTPMIVLFDVTFAMLDSVIVPDTRITAALDDWTAETNAEVVETVTGVALPPPVVPPPCVAHPSRLNEAACAGATTATEAAATATAATSAREIVRDIGFPPYDCG